MGEAAGEGDGDGEAEGDRESPPRPLPCPAPASPSLAPTPYPSGSTSSSKKPEVLPAALADRLRGSVSPALARRRALGGMGGVASRERPGGPGLVRCVWGVVGACGAGWGLADRGVG